jgi:hypothetical protein
MNTGSGLVRSLKGTYPALGAKVDLFDVGVWLGHFLSALLGCLLHVHRLVVVLNLNDVLVPHVVVSAANDVSCYICTDRHASIHAARRGAQTEVTEKSRPHRGRYFTALSILVLQGVVLLQSVNLGLELGHGSCGRGRG